jgi:undecaprenyl-diphosphatase
MSPFQAAVLGAIQGLTEFLPISSSAHLYVVPTLLGWPYAGLAFDVALHWGTLLALLFAYWKDWWTLGRDALAGEPPERRAAWSWLARIAVASIPAVVAGLLLEDAASSALRSLPLQAAMLAIFGILLWAVDRVAPPGQHTDAPGWGTCLMVGAAQALALIPGVSRSGITLTAGRAAGLSRVSAARLSFLLATPITFGAGVLEVRHLPHDVPVLPLAIGVVTAAIVGLLAIRGLVQWLSRSGFLPFCLYRVALAAFIWFRLTRP